MDGHEDMKASTIALVAAFILAVAASFVAGGLIVQRRYENALKRADTIFVVKWKRDTIYEPKDSIIYKWKTVPLPVHDTTEVHDTTTIRDSVLVDVPIWEKPYVGENYRLTVRGFNPELVDIWIKETEAIVKVPYRKRWSFTAGPQVGVGYTPQGWQPYAGAGVTFGYNF